VIGINSSIATMASADSSSSSQSGSIGIGFAIPSNLVKKIADEIMRNGKATHAEMGITITTGAAEANGATRMGAKVVSVTPGTPGADAGLRKGDLIIGFNDNTVTSVYSLLGYVRAASVGETVKLTIIRDGKVLDLDCLLNKVESLAQLKANANTNNSNGSGNSGSSSGSGNSGGFDGFGLLDPFGLF
jgi:putative serine protease PepD